MFKIPVAIQNSGEPLNRFALTPGTELTFDIDRIKISMNISFYNSYIRFVVAFVAATVESESLKDLSYV